MSRNAIGCPCSQRSLLKPMRRLWRTASGMEADVVVEEDVGAPDDALVRAERAPGSAPPPRAHAARRARASQGSMCFGWSGKSAVIRSSNALRRPATMPQSKKTRFGSGSTRASQSNARKASGRSRALRLGDHHERLDGSGYPGGLREGDLELGSRILAVCDVYDALLSPRVYRGPWSHGEALAHLWEHAGTEFDRNCVGGRRPSSRAERRRSSHPRRSRCTPRDRNGS